MKRSFWVFALPLALVITVAAPGSSEAKKCLCPCPHARHRAHRVKTAATAAKAPAAPESVSEPIAGGKTLDHPVSIELDHIYKIDHLMKKGARDYFALPLEPGIELTMAVKALEKGKSGKPHVNMELIDPKNQSVATVTVDGEANEVKRTSYKPTKTGRYVIAISSTGGDLPKDLVFFKTRSAPAPVECAANGAEPVSIQPNTPRDDCFWKDDAKDVFEFDGRKKETYRIEITLANGETAGLRAQLGLEQKKKSPKIIADVSGAGGKVAIESVTLPKKGTYSLEVTLLQASPDVLPYTVTLTGASEEKEVKEKKEKKPRHPFNVDKPHYSTLDPVTPAAQ